MKTHTTNYYNTFITIAEDCPAAAGEVPPLKGDKKTAANLQFELISRQPYQYTSDDVLFLVHACKNDLAESERAAERERYFSRGQACLRASPLTKRYGWGIHFNEEGKVALYGCGTAEYEKLMADDSIKKVKAMLSKRA